MSLRSVCSGVIVVAHREDTSALLAALADEGLSVEEVRGPYTNEQLRYSAIMRCLVNHANAWSIAAARERPTIVVEADFVPVRGMGSLPPPVPADKIVDGLGYLYGVGPEIWDMAGRRLARGHAAGGVALWIPPRVAELLLRFRDEEVSLVPAGAYSPWDSKIGYWLKDRGIQSYIPYRHYGEHGGLGNPEHAVAGLGRAHRADALMAALAFYPEYAKASWVRYKVTRSWARLWGVLRLFGGRFLRWHDFRRGTPLVLLRFAVGRLLLRQVPK